MTSKANVLARGAESADASVTAAALRWAEHMLAHPDDATARSELDAWLQADPLHEQAYARIMNVLTATDELRGTPRAAALGEAALAYQPSTWPDWLSGALAASLAITVAGAALFMALASAGHIMAPWESHEHILADSSGTITPDDGIYQTAVGERSVVALDDGSVITLNTDSEMEVIFASDTRVVRMRRGQAHFEVAPDPARPFRVIADDQVITALGTAFDVRMASDAVTVLLLEGRVSVDQAATLDYAARLREHIPLVELVPGERLVARRTRGGSDVSRPATIEVADIERATSWRTGRLIFDDEPLSGAVAEFNRYTTTPIVIADQAAADYRISGVFRIGQTTSFLAAVEAITPVRATRDADGRIILAASEL